MTVFMASSTPSGGYLYLRSNVDGTPHAGPGAFLLLPVDRGVAPHRIGQLAGYRDELVVVVEVLDRLRLGDCVVERHLLVAQAEFLRVVAVLHDLLGHC